MALKKVNINLESLHLIIDTLTDLVRLDGVAKDEELWSISGTCTEATRASEGIGAISRDLASEVTNILRRIETMKDVLYELARSCERRWGVMKKEFAPFITIRGIQTLPDDILINIFQRFVRDNDRMDLISPEVTLSHMLPDDILVSIFQRFVRDNDRMDLISPEATLSHVCSRFRDVSIGVASLWSEISSSMAMCWIRTRLERSKSGPLTIIINGSTGIRNCKALAEFLRNVVPHASRWKAFHYDYATNGANKDFGALSEYVANLQLPNLESITYRLFPGDTCWPGDCNLLESWDMPNLRDVQLKGIIPSLSSNIFSSGTVKCLRLSWVKWTSAYYDVRSVVHCLISLPGLVDLCLDLGRNCFDSDVQQTPFQGTLPVLTCLSLNTELPFTVQRPMLFSIIMQQLDMPKLRQLQVSVQDSEDRYPVRDLLEIISSRGHDSVTDLDVSIHNRRTDDFSLHLLLNKFPGLQRLSLHVRDNRLWIDPRVLGKMPPLRSFSVLALPGDIVFLKRFVATLKHDARWEGFEACEFRPGTSMRRQKAVKIFTSDKVKWYK
ncbi:hypothetical protein A7U60_g5811 [Sanghuangporus baumii]|uniref:F-box domain-containing protein n=1 Tax=Sanghuangporus baumii TaxID=108892 RepID=A0A9Q5N7L5_SANBA|nr:hypothetical protein A7U60_g5811 [Sanghuangporus baumii]